MEYRYLKAFLLTSKYHSFSKAAEDLNIAQSAVSRQIKLLEESLGEELIIRSSKKVLLTDNGKKLYSLVKNFDESTLNIFSLESQRPLKIGCLDGLVENWLTNLLNEYYKTNSNNVSVHIDTPSGLKKMLNQGDLDIIFTTENIQNEIISSLKLFDEKLVLISRSPVKAQELEKQRWIVFSEKDPLLHTFKKQSSSILTIDSMTAIVNLVKSNIGIAIVPDHALKPTDQLCVQNLRQLKKSEIYMATLSFKNMPPYLKEFCDIAKHQLQ